MRRNSMWNPPGLLYLETYSFIFYRQYILVNYSAPVPTSFWRKAPLCISLATGLPSPSPSPLPNPPVYAPIVELFNCEAFFRIISPIKSRGTPLHGQCNNGIMIFKINIFVYSFLNEFEGCTGSLSELLFCLKEKKNIKFF